MSTTKRCISLILLLGILLGILLPAAQAAPLKETATAGIADPEYDFDYHLGSYGGHTYMLFNGEASSWEMAKDFCESLGGHLATITSAGENAFLYDYMRDCGYSNAYWGLSDHEEEGVWEWCTGEPVAYVNWASGEPNNDYDGAEDYGMFWDERPGGV